MSTVPLFGVNCERHWASVPKDFVGSNLGKGVAPEAEVSVHTDVSYSLLGHILHLN